MGQLAALKRYARSLARNESDAEDLVHDTLVRAYEKQGEFREDGSLKSWLMSVLHNTFVDRMRARRSERTRLDNLAELSERAMLPGQEHSVRLAQIRKAFMSLPDDQRETLHLVAVEGVTYADAARMLGVPVGTVMSRLSRARAALRELESGGDSARDEGSTAVPRLRVVGGNDDDDA